MSQTNKSSSDRDEIKETATLKNRGQVENRGGASEKKEMLEEFDNAEDDWDYDVCNF